MPFQYSAASPEINYRVTLRPRQRSRASCEVSGWTGRRPMVCIPNGRCAGFCYWVRCSRQYICSRCCARRRRTALFRFSQRIGSREPPVILPPNPRDPIRRIARTGMHARKKVLTSPARAGRQASACRLSLSSGRRGRGQRFILSYEYLSESALSTRADVTTR